MTLGRRCCAARCLSCLNLLQCQGSLFAAPLSFPHSSVMFQQSCWGGVAFAVHMLLVLDCCSHGLAPAHPDTTVMSGFPWEVIATDLTVTLFSPSFFLHHLFYSFYFELGERQVSVKHYQIIYVKLHSWLAYNTSI